MFDDLKVRLLLQRKKVKAHLRRMMGRKKPAKSLYALPAVHRTQPQHGLAIVAIVKNEAAYIAEWAEFHLMLGVNHIFLYDNDSTDDTARVLAPYIAEGCVTITPWRNFSELLHPQYAAYAHAMVNHVIDYRWAAFIDVDEFMFPVEGDSLEKTLAELDHQPAVSMPWVNFGPSGHRTKPDGLVIANYTERAMFPPQNNQYSLLRHKNVLDPRQVVGVNTHVFNLRGRGKVLINDCGQEYPNHQSRDVRYATSQKLRLNHYFTRSYEEIEEKIAKGRVSKAGVVNRKALARRLSQYNLATEQDTSIMRFVPELERRLAKRLGVPLGMTA
jgi:Glycosyltransferase family 92